MMPVLLSQNMSFANQLADLLTKSLGRYQVQFICNKLGMYDVYALT